MTTKKDLLAIYNDINNILIYMCESADDFESALDSLTTINPEEIKIIKAAYGKVHIIAATKLLRLKFSEEPAKYFVVHRFDRFNEDNLCEYKLPPFEYVVEGWNERI